MHGAQTEDGDPTAQGELVDDHTTSPPPEPGAIARFLDGWIRSERAFRGREVWRRHPAPDGSPIDRVRYLMIRELWQGGPSRLLDLAWSVGLTPSHASRIVTSLVRSGLVERTVPDGDRRVTVLSVTPAARELLRAMDIESSELIAHHFAELGLSPEEEMTFGRNLQRFADEGERWARATRDGSKRSTSDPAGHTG